jgi:L-fuconolactonase
MNALDAHQHFWRVSRGDYGWLTPEQGGLYRDFEPQDLLPQLVDCNVTGTILVQAAPTEAETRFLLGLAQQHTEIRGVVGWVDFEAADVRERIRALVREGAGKLKGFRPMVQDSADPRWLAKPSLDRAFDALVEHELTFDALVKPAHLEVLIRRVQRHTGLKTVLDHAGKPNIAAGQPEPWASQVQELARTTGSYCKLSGLLTEAAMSAGLAELDPYVAHVFGCFGAQRIIWGSDWPVLTTRASYREWFAMATQLVDRHAPGHAELVFSANARRFYHLD